MTAAAPDTGVTQYWNPVRITFGCGSLERLPHLMESLPGRNVLVVTGRAAMREQGVLSRVQALLTDRTVHLYERVAPNPGIEQAQEVTDFALRRDVDLVVGLGGGSALDVAKVAAAAAASGGAVRSLLQNTGTPLPSLPTVMIPATAGTGSEVTRWATLWDHAEKRKHSAENAGMYAAHALLDPLLTLGQGPSLTAAAGMDALSHAMEAFWNRNANPISDIHALAAVRGIIAALPLVMAAPGDVEARKRMLQGSLWAGLAFSNTKTAAAHSLSYPMTLRYGVVHGQATGITLPALIRFNAVTHPERMLTLAHAVGGNSVEDAADRLSGLLAQVGLKRSLRELGVGEEEREVCVREGYTPDRAGNNLRALDADGLREVLRGVA